MPQTLETLERRRTDLLEQIGQLGDLRPGSVTATTGRCGKSSCHCHQPGAAGHGPNYRLTYKVEGKTVTESLAQEATRRKAEQEVAEFRKWQELSREFVAVNTAICGLRPVEATLTPHEKKRRRRSSRRLPRR